MGYRYNLELTLKESELPKDFRLKIRKAIAKCWKVAERDGWYTTDGSGWCTTRIDDHWRRGRVLPFSLGKLNWPGDFEIQGQVRILLPGRGHAEKVVVAVWSHNNGEYERAADDGRCLNCEGWGCSICNGSGGY